MSDTIAPEVETSEVEGEATPQVDGESTESSEVEAPKRARAANVPQDVFIAAFMAVALDTTFAGSSRIKAIAEATGLTETSVSQKANYLRKAPKFETVDGKQVNKGGLGLALPVLTRPSGGNYTERVTAGADLIASLTAAANAPQKEEEETSEAGA